MIRIERNSCVHILFGFLRRQYRPPKGSCQEVNFILSILLKTALLYSRRQHGLEWVVIDVPFHLA
jgi:hypothetical protein